MDLKSRQIRLVFVDPEDEDIPYWWPALIVPEEEFELFKETMDIGEANITVGSDEQLVCYFEDGIPKSGLVPFNPNHEPFKSYTSRIKHFLTDAGVRRAVNFYNTGRLPKLFKWLILAQMGYLEKQDNVDVLSSGEEVEEVEMLKLKSEHSEHGFDHGKILDKLKQEQEVKNIISRPDDDSFSFSTSSKTKTKAAAFSNYNSTTNNNNHNGTISIDQLLNSPPRSVPKTKREKIKTTTTVNMKKGRKLSVNDLMTTINTTAPNNSNNNNNKIDNLVLKKSSKGIKSIKPNSKTKVKSKKEFRNALEQFDILKLEAILAAAKEASLIPNASVAASKIAVTRTTAATSTISESINNNNTSGTTVTND